MVLYAELQVFKNSSELKAQTQGDKETIPNHIQLITIGNEISQVRNVMTLIQTFDPLIR